MILYNYIYIQQQVHGTLRSSCGRRRDIVCRIVDEVGAAYVVASDGLTSSRSLGGKVWRAVTSGATGRHHGSNDLIDHLLRNLPCPLIIVRDFHTTSRSRSSKRVSDDRPRHFSGEAVANLTSRIRRIRFASGGTGVAALRGSGPSSTSLISRGNQSKRDSVSDFWRPFLAWSGRF